VYMVLLTCLESDPLSILWLKRTYFISFLLKKISKCNGTRICPNLSTNLAVNSKYLLLIYADPYRMTQ
jgi:hypothetical protein